MKGAEIEFVEPVTGLTGSSKLAFAFPTMLLAAAALAAIAGVAAARRSALLKQGFGWVALELVAAATGGLLMYGVVLLGWIPWVVASSNLIGAAPASLIGIIGGYGGEGTFQLILKALKWTNS